MASGTGSHDHGHKGHPSKVELPEYPTAGDSIAPGRSSICEQDRLMPIANLIRIMRSILPSYINISDEAKEAMQECVSEYISFITGEANDRCRQEQRKIVTADDVIWAMEKLGFDDYVHPLNLYLSRYRQLDDERNAAEHVHRVKHRHNHHQLAVNECLGCSTVGASGFLNRAPVFSPAPSSDEHSLQLELLMSSDQGVVIESEAVGMHEGLDGDGDNGLH